MLKEMLQTRMNLEMAATEEMLAIACRVKPQDCCLVPEKRQELTTEGGLDVVANRGRLEDVCMRLTEAGVRVSLFIDADPGQLEAAAAIGVPVVEIHTGHYADAEGYRQRQAELAKIQQAVVIGESLGLQVNAGHGLDYHNVAAVAAIPGVQELNIGHAIIARALFSGLADAVREMKELMLDAARSRLPTN
jgi:pyridoxine 5-phosphate synthase